MASPFLSRIPRVSLVFFVAFSVLVRLTVPLVSQLPTPSASASISVFPGGVPPLHVILGCLFPRFLWVPSREGIYLFWSLCPRIHLFPVRHVGRSLDSNRLLIKSSTRTLFTEASFSLLVLRAIPAVLCLRPPSLPSALWLCPWAAVRLFPFLVNSWLRYFSHSLNYSSHSFRIGAIISAADCESSSSPYHNSWSPVP